jgi:hypothetical protein
LFERVWHKETAAVRLRIILGTALVFVGLVTFTQIDTRAQWTGGWSTGPFCYNPVGVGGSGFGYGYQYNFGGGCYAGFGSAGYGYVGFVPARPYGYGVGRSGFTVTPSGVASAKGTPAWGYPPAIYVASCGAGDCATGSSSQSITRPEIPASAASNATVNYTQTLR